MKVKLLYPQAIIPKQGTQGSACFDIFALLDVEIEPGEVLHIETGLAFEVPEGHALMIYSRSGQGFKNQVTLVNGTGVIDSDYRGEVMIGLRNDGSNVYYQPYGKAIAQAMLIKLPSCSLEIVNYLSETDRGAKGFGSTDIAPILPSRHL